MLEFTIGDLLIWYFSINISLVIAFMFKGFSFAELNSKKGRAYLVLFFIGVPVICLGVFFTVLDLIEKGLK